jgi:hypothetical protein
MLASGMKQMFSITVKHVVSKSDAREKRGKIDGCAS